MIKIKLDQVTTSRPRSDYGSAFINVDLSRLNLLNTKVNVEEEVVVDTGSGNWLMLLMTMLMTLLMMTEPPSPGQGS